MTTVLSSSLVVAVAPNSVTALSTSGGVTSNQNQESFTKVLSGQTSAPSSMKENSSGTPPEAASPVIPQSVAAGSGTGQPRVASAVTADSGTATNSSADVTANAHATMVTGATADAVATSKTPVVSTATNIASSNSDAVVLIVSAITAADTHVAPPSKTENQTGALHGAKSVGPKPQGSIVGKRQSHATTTVNHASDVTDAGAQGVTALITPPSTTTPATASPASPVASRETSASHSTSGSAIASMDTTATEVPQSASDPRIIKAPGASLVSGVPEAKGGPVVTPVVALASGAGAMSSGLSPSRSLPAVDTVPLGQGTGSSLSSTGTPGPVLNALEQAAPTGRAITNPGLDAAASRRGVRSSSDVAPSIQTTHPILSPGVMVHSSGTEGASNATAVAHSSTVGVVSAPDVSRTMNSSVNVADHAFAAQSFTRGGSALDVSGLSSVISRPLSQGNGTYTVTLAMHPAELGHVQAVMSLTGNELRVSLTPHTDHGHAALTAAATELKNELARGGVNVTIDLRHPQSPMSGDGGRHEKPYAKEQLPARAAILTVPTPSARDAGQIHLML